MDTVELVTKMSYRDAVAEGKLFTAMPSPSTFNRQVIEYGERLEAFKRGHCEGWETT